MAGIKIFAVDAQEPAGGHAATVEEKLAQLETALQRAEKRAMAGRLAASVMHEINNPSQAIADLVYLLAREADDAEKVRARAAQIEEQLLRIQNTTRQTLSFFRDSPQKQTRDLVPLVETALRYHSELLSKKEIRVVRQFPISLVGLVYPGEFLQLVSNLVRNAAEALPNGGTLRVKLQALRSNFYLTVSDSGPGIAPSIKAHLFEAFQSNKAEGGNGLGLWICRTVVEKHGGRIYCRSCSEGTRHGTTFLVSFPLGYSNGQAGSVVPFLRQG